MKKDAIISKDGKFRYKLSRVWDEGLPNVVIVGLNPSIADADIDDPTYVRCVNFAKSWGYGSLSMLNLFAYRATDPAELLNKEYIIGEDNDTYLKQAFKHADKVVCAWGNGGTLFGRNKEVLQLIDEPYCIKMNKSGEPAHPLYLGQHLAPIKMEKPKGKFENLIKAAKVRKVSEYIQVYEGANKMSTIPDHRMKHFKDDENIIRLIEISDKEFIFSQSDTIIVGEQTFYWYQSRLGEFYTKSNGEVDAEHESEELIISINEIETWRAVVEKEKCPLELRLKNNSHWQSVRLGASELDALNQLQLSLNKK